MKNVAKSTLKKISPAFLIRYFRHTRNLRMFLTKLSELQELHYINNFKDIHQIARNANWSAENTERLMMMTYYETMGINDQRNKLKSREVNIYNRNGEDGLLLYIFSRIGVKNKKYINIGAGGRSSNSANLVINFGWGGLEIDGSEIRLKIMQKMLKEKDAGCVERCLFFPRWITRDNVNTIIKEGGISGDVDMLSIDIDGNDYWVWDSIEVVKPRVVVIEYNAFLGAKKSITVKYDQNFNRFDKHPTGFYCGASLSALDKLAKEKGYSLIGCDSNGVNAYFILDELMGSNFHRVTPQEAYYPHFQSYRINEEEMKSLNRMEYTVI